MGATKELIRKGQEGKTPQRGNTVTVHCTGYGKNGDLSEKFWSTKDKGQEPFSFKVGMGQVIKGWDEQVLLMELGEKARITCTPDYAYGEGGFEAWGYPLFFSCCLLAFLRTHLGNHGVGFAGVLNVCLCVLLSLRFAPIRR